ncbi:MAG: polysaccharide deacetylase family protein [Rhodospirillaceae bacterium]
MVMKPRDRIVYSAMADRTPLALPDGKRVAVWIVVNVENWDIEQPMPRTVLPPPGNRVHVPDIPNWSWQEYGMRVGFWRLHEALTSRGIPATLSVNGSVCSQYPRLAGAARDAGWEFLGHAYRQRPTHLVEDQREDIRLTVETIREFTGRPPRGWMGPGLTETYDTPDYLAEAGIEYVADFPMDDRPFEIRTEHGPLVSIPYTVELNDIPMMIVQHHKAPEFYDRCMDNFERLYAEGERDARVMAIAVHPYISGTPFRIKYFEKVLDDISKHPGVLMWTGNQVLDWYRTATG